MPDNMSFTLAAPVAAGGSVAIPISPPVYGPSLNVNRAQILSGDGNFSAPRDFRLFVRSTTQFTLVLSSTLSLPAGTYFLSVPPLIEPTFSGSSVRSRKVAVLGDSRAQRCYNTSVSANAVSSENFAWWAQVEAPGGGWRWDTDTDANFGVSGERTNDILARADTWMTYAQQTGATFIIVSGRNDNQVQLISREQTVANLFLMRDMLLNEGCRVIMTTDAPQGTASAPGNVLAGDGGLRHQWMREQILARAGEAAGRFFVVDTWTNSTVVGGDGSGIQGLDPFLIDGTHWGVTGARNVGRLMVPALNAIFPEPVDILPVNNATFNAATMPTSPRNLNPMLTGTTGTVSAPATGVAPANWQLQRAGTDTTVAGSQVVDPDGTPWYRITVGGTATAGGQGALLRMLNPQITYEPEGRYRACCEWRVPTGSNLTNCRSVSLEIRPTIGGSAILNETVRATGEAMPDVAYGRRTVLTPTTPVGSITNMELRFNVTSAVAGAVNCVVDVRAIALRRVA